MKDLVNHDRSLDFYPSEMGPLWGLKKGMTGSDL